MTGLDASDARSVPELVAALGDGARPEWLFFWGHHPRGPGEPDKACLSQWWPAAFEADGERFASAEHYMMWSKARLFGDDRSARAILAADSPARAKKLGRRVTGFDEERWRRARWDVVVTGSCAKFSADPRLCRYLLGTGRAVLVEASPVDRVWGIGLAADAGSAREPAQWPGLNLLGFALMEARALLA